MAQVVSPLLFEVIEHTQVSGTAQEFREVQFSLASDEAVRLIKLTWWIQAVQNIGVADAMYQAFFTLDPNPDPVTLTSGTALNLGINSDTIWNPRAVVDLAVSGYSEGISVEHVFDIPGEGILVAHNINVGFNSNNTGGQMGARIWYEVVRLDDREVVSLVARRRAR